MGLAYRIAKHFPESKRWRLVWIAFAWAFAGMLASRLLVLLLIYEITPPAIISLHRIGSPLVVSIGLFVGMLLLYRLLGPIRPMSDLMPTMHAATITITPESVITSWDSGAERMFGYAARAAVGRTLTEPDFIMPERYHAAHLAGLARFMSRDPRTTARRNYYVSARHADGHEFPVEVEVNVVQQPNGEQILFSGTIRRVFT